MNYEMLNWLFLVVLETFFNKHNAWLRYKIIHALFSGFWSLWTDFIVISFQFYSLLCQNKQVGYPIKKDRSLGFGTCCHANRIISTGKYLHPSMRDIISTHCVDFLRHLTRVSFTSTTSLFWLSRAPPTPYAHWPPAAPNACWDVSTRQIEQMISSDSAFMCASAKTGLNMGLQEASNQNSG